MRTFEHIAYLLIAMLKRSGKSRFRLSRKSLQVISGRSQIKSGLINNISEWLEGSAVMIPLDRGGYVVISQESLEGIAPLKIGTAIPEWKSLSISDLREEVEAEEDIDDE